MREGCWATAGFVAWVCGALVGLASVRNGEFSEGLRGWKAAWSARVSNGEAALTDSGADPCFLYQAVPVPAGVLTIEFEFLNGVTAEYPAGGFRDTFFASVYFVDDPADFVLENDRFAAGEGILDLDALGLFNVRGAVTPSARGGGWQHFSGTVTNRHAYAVLTFELYNLNGVRADSEVRIDQVNLTATGEP